MKLSTAFVVVLFVGGTESKLLRKSVAKEDLKKQDSVWGGILGSEQLELNVSSHDLLFNLY